MGPCGLREAGTHSRGFREYTREQGRQQNLQGTGESFEKDKSRIVSLGPSVYNTRGISIGESRCQDAKMCLCHAGLHKRGRGKNDISVSLLIDGGAANDYDERKKIIAW